LRKTKPNLPLRAKRKNQIPASNFATQTLAGLVSATELAHQLLERECQELLDQACAALPGHMPVLPEAGPEGGQNMNASDFPLLAVCPACGAVVPSRRARLCAVCERPLPEVTRFPPAEAARQSAEFQKIRNRMRADSEVSALDRVSSSDGAGPG